jgi:hypothetical protein
VRFLQLAATLGLSVGLIGFLFRKIAYRGSCGLVWCRAKIAKGAMLVPTCIARSLLAADSCLKNGSHHAPQPPKQLQHETMYRRGKPPLPHKNKTETAATKKSTPPLPTCEIPKPTTPHKTKTTHQPTKRKTKKPSPRQHFGQLFNDLHVTKILIKFME